MDAFEPSTTALLVMDYQVGIVGRIPGAEALLDRVDGVISDVRGRGGHVGWVRVGFDEADFAAIPPTSVMAQVVPPERRAAMHADSPTTQIHSRLHPRPEDASVRKTRIGAFSTTDLDRQLAERKVDTLVLVGISTSGVVLSTLREAIDRDYRIVVLRDLCADPDPATHAFLVDTLYPRYATVIDARDLAGLWA